MIRRIKILIYAAFFLSAFNCHPQNKETQLQVDFENEFNNIDFEFFLFFENELVSICSDSAAVSKFSGLLKSYEKHNKKTEDDIKEAKLLLQMLYNRINAITPNNQIVTEGKQTLLNILRDYKKLDFKISKDLILTQVDGAKRNLVNGYEEGTVVKSWLIFFYHNPVFFKSVLVDGGKVKSWEKADIMLCNIFRQNELPFSFRHHLKDEITAHLQKYTSEDHEVDELIHKVKLCDVTKNLYD